MMTRHKRTYQENGGLCGRNGKDIPGHMVDQLDNNLAPVIDNWVSQVQALAERRIFCEQLRDELLTLMPDEPGTIYGCYDASTQRGEFKRARSGEANRENNGKWLDLREWPFNKND